MKKLVFSLTITLLSIYSVFAQDVDKCKDHSLFTRMKGFSIVECTTNFNKLDTYNSAGEDIQFEGYLTYIDYIFNTETGEMPSNFQIIKNYQDAILAKGGKKIYTDENYGCFELKSNGKEFKILLRDFYNETNFKLYILEMEPMIQEITANAMLDALNKDGFIALSILFETAKYTIQKESLPIVEQIFELMKNNPTLKISIEGHTDNVGDAASNKTLSNNRAKAIFDALVTKGIDKSRMSFVGWGQENPVADNRTEDGRTKNRRVEIVKK
jgi:outer membrane protein OmpA-like peptidoglycan-associated protein